MKETIVQNGDPVLRHKAKHVLKKDIGSRHIHTVIARMKKSLAGEEYGVAIAAPQLGESLRIFVIAGKAFVPRDDSEDADKKKKVPKDMVFINPKLNRLSRKKHEMSEGCLSVRGKYGTVLRHEKASIEALNEKGESFTYHGSGLIAHIFQHEVDHLEGILYIDKAIKIEEDDWKNLHKRRDEEHVAKK